MTDSIKTVQFSDLALVMKELGQDQGDERKVYLKLENGNRLITVIGKDEKNLNARELIKIVEKTIERAKEGSITETSALEWGDVISGLEAMKGRMTSYKEEMSSIKRFILSLFGVISKKDRLVGSIDKIIHVAQKYLLMNEIALLKKELKNQEAELKQASENLQTSPLKTSSELERKIEVIKGAITQKQGALDALSELDQEVREISLTERQGMLRNELESSIGRKGNTDAHVMYLRKLIFGFSVGQKQTIEEMTHLEPTFNGEDLTEMLEGGAGFMNLFYVARFLDHYIPKANQKDSASLRKLNSDIQRGLLFGFRLRAIELSSPIGREKNLSILLSDIKTALEKMETGERLLLPVGTRDHETLLSFKKCDEGKIEVTYYNTGDGLEENMSTSINLKSIKELFAANFAGKFPIKKTFKDAPLDEKMDSMLESLLRNRIDDGTIADLNGHLTRGLGEGTTGEPKEVQINGVCSYQVLSESFQDFLGPEIYPSFHHDFLTYLQDSFKEAIKEKSSTNEIEQSIDQMLLSDNQREISRIEQVLAA